MSGRLITDIYGISQDRDDRQLTIHRRGVLPFLKNTFIYHDYAYGWIPETALWNSQYEKLDLRNYYPVTIGLLNKFEFMLSLDKRPPLQYTPKNNSPMMDNVSAVRIKEYFRKFSILPDNQLISFLLLTSIPIYNILYFFKNTAFNPSVHSLFNMFYIDNEKHIELAKYLIRGGDYKPTLSMLDEAGLYDESIPLPPNILGLIRNRNRTGIRLQQQYIDLESLGNISAIISSTNQDPVITFLMFYLPGLSVTTEITPAVEMLMKKLGLTKENIILV
ncbi:putative membrane protein [Albatrosspox virus]|nr:putative membrane protein [Penguinpox virus 2]QRM16087.1 putative membrane protein [Albatrosspox virus]